MASHIRTYLESGGAKGHHFRGTDSLLLTTRGRKSGRLRRTALYYGRDGGAYLVVASNGGSSKHPLWYLNLREHPLVEVQVGSEIFEAPLRARDRRGEVALVASDGCGLSALRRYAAEDQARDSRGRHRAGWVRAGVARFELGIRGSHRQADREGDECFARGQPEAQPQGADRPHSPGAAPVGTARAE